MGSRMTKYYDDTKFKTTRYHKNEELYKEICNSELENYEVRSNATIIGDNNKEIDIEGIKKILDTKYNKVPQRKSIRIEEDQEEVFEKEDTKEYDINVILEKAKEQKSDVYEVERLKKLRDTQYDILKNLNFEKEDSKDDDDNDDLKKLINTITINESNATDNSPLEMLSDLKGSDDTEVLEGLKEDDRTKNFDTKMINSFYTSTNALNKDDFEDNDNFSKDIESNNIFIKIVIALIIVLVIIGIFIIVKTTLFK